ncbi:MAG: glutaminyl-peptide cyclotransferase [Nitrospiraceae bacterium]|nr:MAG: glutaminyl-peptide cyclotransferase [Nitrospiraceae bacterium]
MRSKNFIKGLTAGLIVFCFIRPDALGQGPSSVPVFSYRVVSVYPHDRKAFTQGLFFEDGILYEGTGLHGESALRKIKLESGAVLKTVKLPQEFFGEGITALGNRIIQLTWRSHTAFVYDKDSFRLLDKFDYPTEGWGVTYTGRHLVMSDGTENLYFLDPETFKEIRRVRVFDERGFVIRLNELEYVRGEIYANVWPTNRIAKIDPKTGRVTEWINLDGLPPVNDYDNRKALNGIAYDEKGDRLFVTGKLWPYIYEIKPVPAESSNPD